MSDDLKAELSQYLKDNLSISIYSRHDSIRVDLILGDTCISTDTCDIVPYTEQSWD